MKNSRVRHEKSIENPLTQGQQVKNSDNKEKEKELEKRNKNNNQPSSVAQRLSYLEPRGQWFDSPSGYLISS